MISELTTLKQNNENTVAWKNSGFLDGIHDENDIKNLIISYDSLYDYFITKDEISENDEYLATILFPITRRIYNALEKKEPVMSETIINALKEIKMKDVFGSWFNDYFKEKKKEVCTICEENNFTECSIYELNLLNLYNTLRQHFHCFIDFEAELCASLADVITEKYYKK